MFASPKELMSRTAFLSCFLFTVTSLCPAQEGASEVTAGLAAHPGGGLETLVTVPAFALQNADAAEETPDGPQSETKEIREAIPPWSATDWHEALSNPKGYRGNRGNVTAQGMSGMFLNPTSGTLDQGQFTLQYCVLFSDKPDFTGHGILASYGLTDYLEVGVFALLADIRGAVDRLATVVGPEARFRLLKDEDWMPEVSIGGIYLDGNSFSDRNARSEVVGMISKRVPLWEEGFLRSSTLHGGLRQIFRSENPPGTDRSEAVGYFGGEVEFPFDVHFVGEISTVDQGIGNRVPWAVGGQWRPNNVFGISLAAVRNGNMSKVGIFIGIAVGGPQLPDELTR